MWPKKSHLRTTASKKKKIIVNSQNYDYLPKQQTFTEHLLCSRLCAILSREMCFLS